MYQNFPRENYGTPPSYGSSSYHGDHNSYYNQTSSCGVSSSDVSNRNGAGVLSDYNESAAVALLQHLDRDELQHLLDNDSKLQDLIEDLPQVRSIQQGRDDLIATNKSLAEYNLSLQPKLEELKQIVAVDYEKINSLKTDLAKNKTKLDGFVGRRSLDTLLALLQTEAAKSEEESEDLATNFYDNGMDMEEFVNQYLPRRTESHLRRIKSERMAELIRENQYSGLGGGSGISSSMHAAPQMSTNRPPYPNYSSSGAPYPTSAAFGMPQPGLYH